METLQILRAIKQTEEKLLYIKKELSKPYIRYQTKRISRLINFRIEGEEILKDLKKFSNQN